MRRFVFLLVFQAWTGWAWAKDYPVRDGDLVFQNSQSRQCAAISAATHSPYTHVGLVLFVGGKPFVYEAVQPVVKTPLNAWAARGKDGHFVVKRLNAADKVLGKDEIAKLRTEAERFMGRNYDWTFEWSDEKIYCSELVWKTYQRALGLELAPLRKLRDFDLAGAEVKKILRERYGNTVPYGETVIAPSDLFDSKTLREAFRNP